MGEIMIILVLALVLLGPAKLPDAAKSIGKAMRDFRKATDDVRTQFDSVINEEPKGAVKPKLVDAAAPGGPPGIPPGGVPLAAGEIPPASQQNVPGLEAALAEPAPQPAFLKKAIAPAAPPPAEPPVSSPASEAVSAAAEAQPKA
jgi:sec-independent protein translocase protein TatB